MTQLLPSLADPVLSGVLAAFDLPGDPVEACRHGQGHINDTYRVCCRLPGGEIRRYILQCISTAAFPYPDSLMENFSGITAHLRRKIIAAGGDPSRETLSLVKTRDGRDFYTDAEGKVWRITPYIENTDCYDQATAELFEASARAFGKFQYLLQDYPAETLHESIVNFHHTEERFAKFLSAVSADPLGRAAAVQEEIGFVLARQADCSVALDAFRAGRLPLRVTHNDTKLNNVLIDRDSGEGICVIDLDTTMPGLSMNDFGDSIRFGANHAREDEPDLGKVNFDISLYEVFTRGFLEGARGSLTPEELRYLPWGARLMTLECGIRFLTDYLEGDRYFHISDPEQNLRRCRTQFKLVRDMEEQFDQMAAVVAKYS